MYKKGQFALGNPRGPAFFPTRQRLWEALQLRYPPGSTAGLGLLQGVAQGSPGVTPFVPGEGGVHEEEGRNQAREEF